jgi:MFS family permease
MNDQIRADRWKILPIVLLAPFMGSQDGSIVNVALPTIARRLGAGMDGIQWVVSSYLIVISALVLFFGKVADKIGKVGIFEYGFLVFGAGSVDALARNMGMVTGIAILFGSRSALTVTRALKSDPGYGRDGLR